MRLQFGRDWKKLLLWLFLGIIFTVIVEHLAIPLIFNLLSPHSNVEIILNRIYSLIGTNSSIKNPDSIFLSSINDIEKIFFLKNVKNSTLKEFQIVFPVEFSCCENITNYLITIRNTGNALAHNVEIIGNSTYKPNITTSPANAVIEFGKGYYSNQFKISLTELSKEEPLKVAMTTSGLSYITFKIYVDNKQISDNKIAILDSVIIDYIPFLNLNNCSIVVPHFVNFSYPMLLQLKGSNTAGCNLYWETVYPSYKFSSE